VLLYIYLNIIQTFTIVYRHKYNPTALILGLQQLEEEKEKLESEIEELKLEGIDQEGIKMFIDALDEVMENGGNEQKKHLIQVLVEKVLVYDKDRYEFCFRPPDGEIIAQPIKDARNDEANPLSVSHLAEQVCNHIQDAPREGLKSASRRNSNPHPDKSG
jgi:hypothetical protein